MIVGIVGGGQLARMLMLAGYPLGLRFLVLDPSADACAGQVGELIQADYDDAKALKHLAMKADVVTFEFENIPDQSIHFLSEQIPAFPPPKALEIARDRIKEKTLFLSLDIPTPNFIPVNSQMDLDKAVSKLGLPLLLKTCTLGYDGKGQAKLESLSDIETVWTELGGVPLIAEQFIHFDREISIIAARGRSGETAFYPVPENTHSKGILRHTVCQPDDPLQALAESYAIKLLDELDYVGILTLELFDVDGKLVANEIAPRVHNSGHWTIEGAKTSQFENHLRAILGWPLGATQAINRSAMVNFIGNLPDPRDILSQPDVHLHLYGKKRRPGRKVGHATLNAVDSIRLNEKLQSLTKLVETTRCPSTEITGR